MRIQESPIWPWLSLVAVWTAAFSLSCRLSVLPIDAAQEGNEYSTARALLGESRVALSGHFYEMADLYFHRGAGHKQEKAFEGDFFQRIAGVVSPQEHVHISGQNITEIMPWLWLAIRTNPHNVELYLVTAFWLAGKIDRPDLAQEVLVDAQRNNPRSYEVLLEWGRLCLKQGKQEAARHKLDAALALWPGTQAPESESARQDKRNILIHRGLLYEVEGANDQAIAAYREVVALFPGQRSLRKRTNALSRGDTPSVLATHLRAVMLEDHRKARLRCSREHEGEDHCATDRANDTAKGQGH